MIFTKMIIKRVWVILEDTFYDVYILRVNLDYTE